MKGEYVTAACGNSNYGPSRTQVIMDLGLAPCPIGTTVYFISVCLYWTRPIDSLILKRLYGSHMGPIWYKPLFKAFLYLEIYCGYSGTSMRRYTYEVPVFRQPIQRVKASLFNSYYVQRMLENPEIPSSLKLCIKTSSRCCISHK